MLRTTTLAVLLASPLLVASSDPGPEKRAITRRIETRATWYNDVVYLKYCRDKDWRNCNIIFPSESACINLEAFNNA